MTAPLENSAAKSSLGPYLLQSELGRNREGGRITYLALDSERQMQVVLKQFRFVQTESSWSGFKAYEREIEILQAIHHPRVPRYLKSFETDDGFCMVQEYKAAPSLAERQHLTPQQIQVVGCQLLEILADLQTQIPPIIHRDIKPENILVDDDLTVYLIDFGLAKLNHDAIALSSVAAGTPGFMPPEELFNRPLDTAADLYSVGASLISLLTHTPSTHMGELIDENYRFNFISHLPPINPLMHQWLSQMVEPNPRDRFPNAQVALSALQTIDINDLSSAQTVQSPQRFLNHPFSSGTLILGGLFGLLGLLGVYLLWPSTAPSPSPRPQSATLSPEQQWFETIKPHCNALEVVTAVQNSPYPNTNQGLGYAASCYAFAGKLDKADATIQSADESARPYIASILFELGHPVADRGDDESAGPIMELVLKYWPENYMALYHAGMSAYVLAENEKAVQYLQRFIDLYEPEDGWHQKAVLALDRIRQGIPADQQFKVHH